MTAHLHSNSYSVRYSLWRELGTPPESRWQPSVHRSRLGVDSGGSVSEYLRLVITYGDARGWGALADRTRRAIVAALADRPLSVGELAADMPVSRPAVSQHLKVLKDAGLVSEHQEGTRRIYQLNPVGLAALRDQLDTYWRRALTNYAEVLSDDIHRPGESGDRAQPRKDNL